MSTEPKSTKLPWMKFYPGAWRNDPGVRALDYETRGHWFEMICIMHDSDHRGKLTLNGKAMPDEALALCLGIDQAKLQQTLSKLLAYGVAEREQDTGILYCRRMVREDNLHEKRADAGQKGGKARAAAACSSKTQANAQQSTKQNPSKQGEMLDVRSQMLDVATEQQGAGAPAAGAASPPDDDNEAPPLALAAEPPTPKPPSVMGALAGPEKLEADLAAIEKRKSRAPAAVAVPIPIILDTPAFRLRWASWLQYRREMKKPLTPTSQAQQLDNFLKIGEARAIAMIEHTITMGWQGLREPDEQSGNGNGGAVRLDKDGLLPMAAPGVAPIPGKQRWYRTGSLPHLQIPGPEELAAIDAADPVKNPPKPGEPKEVTEARDHQFSEWRRAMRMHVKLYGSNMDDERCYPWAKRWGDLTKEEQAE